MSNKTQEELDEELDELMYNQGIEDFNGGEDPVVADLAYIQGYAQADYESRNAPPARPEEHLPY